MPVFLLRTMRAFIAAQQLLTPHAPVVVAVSGGPDSLCLLHALAALQDELAITLHVAHLDHMIRGAESAEEARFVAATAQEWELPATIEAADVPALALHTRTNLHAAARLARYTFLASVAQSIGAQAVAVAHHAGDQAETVLLHMLRGAGPEGLRGMRPLVAWEEWAPAAAGEPGGAHPALIRPLLTTTRTAIEQYCAAHALLPRRDPSNDALDATRNRIRHALLPQLIEYNPNIVAALGRTAAISADVHAFIQSSLNLVWPRLVRERSGALDFDGAAWQGLPAALQREALRRAHAQLAPGAMLELEHTDQARALIARGVGRRLDLPGGLALVVGYRGAFTLGAAPAEDGPQISGEALVLPNEGRIALANGWMIEVAHGAPAAPRDAWAVDLDADALAQPLLLRRRRPGERIRLAGGSRRLQDVFVDAKTPRALRGAWPLLATPDEVVWVVGLRAAAAYLATPASRRIIHIRLSKDL